MSWLRRLVGSETLEVFVDEVVGKQRPRSTHANGIFRTYTPKKTLEAERAIRTAWVAKVGYKWACFDGPLTVRIDVFRALAKSNPKFWEGRIDTGKPDGDNVLKLVMDALNGTAWKDDSQAFGQSVSKNPRPSHEEGSSLVIRVYYYEETYSKEK